MITKEKIRNILKEMENKNTESYLKDEGEVDMSAENDVEDIDEDEDEVDYSDIEDLINAIEVVDGVDEDGEFSNPVKVNLKPGDVVAVEEDGEFKEGEVETDDEGNMEVDFDEDEDLKLLDTITDDDYEENEENEEENEEELEELDEAALGSNGEGNSRYNYSYDYNYESDEDDEDLDKVLMEDDELDSLEEELPEGENQDELDQEVPTQDELEKADLGDLGKFDDNDPSGIVSQGAMEGNDELDTDETEIDNGGSPIDVDDDDEEDIIIDLLKDGEDLDFLADMDDDNDLFHESVEYGKISKKPAKSFETPTYKKVSDKDLSIDDLGEIEDELEEALNKPSKSIDPKFDGVKGTKPVVVAPSYSKVTPAAKEKVENKHYEKLKEEVEKLRLENYKLLKVNGLLTILPNLSAEAKENLVESFDKCKTAKSAKLLYGRVAETIKEYRKPNINQLIVENVSKGSGRRLFTEEEEQEEVNNENTQEQKRKDYLCGISKEDEYYQF